MTRVHHSPVATSFAVVVRVRRCEGGRPVSFDDTDDSCPHDDRLVDGFQTAVGPEVGPTGAWQRGGWPQSVGSRILGSPVRGPTSPGACRPVPRTLMLVGSAEVLEEEGLERVEGNEVVRS